MPETLPPKGLGPMARREMRLAYAMLLPTFFIVMAIVLVPLLANLWISFKSVHLSNIRIASLSVNETLRGTLETANDIAEWRFRVRNSSPVSSIAGAGFTDIIPNNLNIVTTDERCTIIQHTLRCELGDVAGGKRDQITLGVRARPSYLQNPINPRASKPIPFGRASNVLTNFDFTIDNFVFVFSADEFFGVLKVSLAYTFFGTLGAVVLGLFAAQLLNTRFAGRNIVRGLFLFPYVAPVIAVAFTWVVLLDPFSGTINSIFQHMGVIDKPINFFGQRAVAVHVFGFTFHFPVALTTVIAFEAWRYFPLSFLFILARMQSIPADMFEAAEMDGATRLQQFWYISIPQLMGILAALFLLRFIWTFNKFDDIFLLTGGNAGTRTLTVDVYEQAFAVSNLGAGAAVAVVIMVLLLAFSILFFKFAPKDSV